VDAYTARTAYGIDWSDDCLTIVRQSRGAPPETLFARPPDADPAALADLAGQITAEVARGRAVSAAAMPAAESFTRWLQTPLRSVAKARKVLPSLLDIQLPFPLESCVCQFLECRPSAAGGAIEALAVAARGAHLEAWLDRLRALGLDPVVLDHEALALWTQSRAEAPGEAGVPRIVALLAGRHAVLAVGQGDDYRGALGVRLESGAAGPRQLAGRVSQFLRAQLPPADERPFEWYWVGAGAEDKTVLAAWLAALDEPGRYAFARHAQPAAFLARALAARALEPGLFRCNLRAGGAAEHPQTRRRDARRQIRAAVSALLAGLFLCAISVGWRAWLAWRTDAAQAQLSGLAARLTGMPRVPRGQEVMLVGRALDENATRLQPFLDALRPGAEELLYALAGAAASNRLFVEELALLGGRLTVRGSAPDWERAEALVACAREQGWRVELERQEAGADERVPFVVKGEGGWRP